MSWRPTASWKNLALRAQLLRRLRSFFEERGFVEVETPTVSADTVVDRHLDPFSVHDFRQTVGWLQTSPEFAMKRLLAAGAPWPIYQVAQAYRQEELGPLHNPEFTLVEWYRQGDGLEEGMRLLADLAEALLGRGPVVRQTYAEAFRERLGIDPHSTTSEELSAMARRIGQPPDTLSPEDRDGWLDFLLAEQVQPHLGRPQPTMLYDYPASQAALARVRPGPPAVAERFELYVDGIELANGYHEALEPSELRRRSAEANSQRIADGKPALPVENRLLAAMEHGLPSCAGVALGFDRLVMVAAGATALEEVLPFPFPIA